MTAMFSDAQIPIEGEAAFYVLSKAAMEVWVRKLNETFAKLLIGTLPKESITVTPDDGEIFEDLKGRVLEAANS